MMAKYCSGCGASLEKKKRRSEYHVVDNAIFCLQCYRNNTRQNRHSDENLSLNVHANTSTNETNNNTQITLSLSKTNYSHAKCILCQRSDRLLRRLFREECVKCISNQLRISSFHMEFVFAVFTLKMTCCFSHKNYVILV